MTAGFRGTDAQISTGTVVRVVDVTPQAWPAYELVCERDERELIGCYLGKIGRVALVDDKDMPYIVVFSDGARVPLAEMRFHRGEVEEA